MYWSKTISAGIFGPIKKWIMQAGLSLLLYLRGMPKLLSTPKNHAPVLKRSAKHRQQLTGNKLKKPYTVLSITAALKIAGPTKAILPHWDWAPNKAKPFTA